jgi:hypothetical protein
MQRRALLERDRKRLFGLAGCADHHRARCFHSIMLRIAMLVGTRNERVFVGAGEDLTAEGAFYRK